MTSALLERLHESVAAAAEQSARGGDVVRQFVDRAALRCVCGQPVHFNTRNQLMSCAEAAAMRSVAPNGWRN